MAENLVTEVDIWTGIVAPDGQKMPPEYARTVLQWKFTEAAKSRMEQLAGRNNEGELTDAEREELEDYVHVGQVLGILQAKARLALKHVDSNGDL